MDKIGEQSKSGNDTRQARKLPAEIVGRFLQNLSVVDRLKSERVSPHWKRAFSKWSWTEQRKLDARNVFEGASMQSVARFWANLDGSNCQLTLLFHCCGHWLRELDLQLFGEENIQRFLPQIIKSFESIKNLEKLNIRGLRLRDFVDHLPHTLLDLKISTAISIETLQALSGRCPNLEEVPFEDLENKSNLKTEALIELIEKFPRQKKLNLNDFTLRSEKHGALASFEQLKALEHLDLFCCDCLDGESLAAIVGGCQRLRYLSFDAARHLTEGELFQMTQLQNLTVLIVDVRHGGGGFSDVVLKAIAQRGKLKKLYVIGSKSENASLTDASIAYLVDRCKSLVSLAVFWCPKISVRSLRVIVAEVRRRRHGSPPGTLPTGDLDPQIFYFDPFCTGIDAERARHLISSNQWMRFGGDPRQII